QPAPKEKPGFYIIADRAQLKGGKINFTDERGQMVFKTVVGLDEIGVKNYNSAPGSKFGLKAAISTDADEKAGVEGDIGISPLDASGRFTLAGLDLKRYAPYYSGMVTFDIRDGKFDMFTDFACTQADGKLDAKAGNLSAKLTGLKLRQQGGKDDFLSVPSLSVDDSSADLGKRQATLGSLKTEGGRVAVIRDEDGKLNLAGLVKQGSAKAAPQAKTGEAPWSVTLSKAEGKSWSAKITDLTNEEPVEMALTGITLGASGISTMKGAKGKASLAFKLDKKGAVKLSGPVSLTPFGAGLDVALKDIDIAPFQPYFYDRVKVFVTGGRFAAKGRLDIAQQKDGSMKTRYRGGAGVYEFGTVDKEYADEFVNWKALDLRGMDISVNPLSVRMDEVALADFYSRLILNADGTLNVQSVMVEENPPAQGPKPALQPQPQRQPVSNAPAKKTPVLIGTVSLQAGRINFTDRSVQPNYTADLTEVTGRVSGLTSEEQKTADLDLRSTFNGFAPLEISGRVNPLASDLFVDLKARFADMELSPVTPYSGKYLGYTIEKGKLSLDVRYKIEKKTLNSSNVIFIDQLNFGDKVKSDKATTLPVKLAVALLKDRSGQIKLDLPVTGRTDDPQFSIGRIILKILKNLLVKAATSPFALLGSIFGGGPDLGYVEFGYGSSALSPDDLKKVATIEKAMFDRPALKLSIEGHVDMDRDREELRRVAFDRKLKVQKLKDTKAGVTVDEVTILPAEYEKYLGKAYGAEKFPKPKNILGLNKSLPPAEMEKLILTNLKITDDDLRGLAQERAQKGLSELLKSGKIEPGRVFITQGATLQPKPKEGQKNSRVDFSLE
ncbi:MAG TPA: DUF748 domain-containing protein, partial [Nitrospirota bacterium]